MQDRSPTLLDVANQVDALLRQFNAQDHFRKRVREASKEQTIAMMECARRSELRSEAVAKEAGWYVSVDAPPAKDGYFGCSETFFGRIKLPAGIPRPSMGLTHDAEFPNRPMGPRCISDRIPRCDWSCQDERESEKFNQKLREWEEQKIGYVALPKKGTPSKLEEDWRPIFELAKKRSFPDEGDGGIPYVFTVEAWLPANLHPDHDPPTDPLPVSGDKVSLNFKYAALAAVYDAHWAGSELIAPWGTVTSRGKVRPASGVPKEWTGSNVAGSYQAASWYWRQMMSAKELCDGDTAVVASWVADVKADLTKAFPKMATKSSTLVDAKCQRAPRGPGAKECKALFIALLTMLPEDQHFAATKDWTAAEIARRMKDQLGLDREPTEKTIQRMLVSEGYRPRKGAGKNPNEFDGTHWDDPEHSQRRRMKK